MKKAIHFILIILSLNTYSQCDKIEKRVNELKGETILSSPYNSRISMMTGIPKSGGFMQIQNIKNEKSELTFITFYGSGVVSLIGYKGLYIKLSNDEIIRFENQKINSSYSSKGFYTYYSILDLDSDLIEKLKKNTIVQYNLYDFEYKIKEKDSKKFQDYVICIDDLTNIE